MNAKMIVLAILLVIGSLTAACIPEPTGDAPAKAGPDGAAAAPAKVAPQPIELEGELKTIQEQMVGTLLVSVVNLTGSLQQGDNQFAVEFRRDGKLTDVGNAGAQAILEVAGGEPVTAPMGSNASLTAGRFNFATNLAMAGTWKVQIIYGSAGKADFSIDVQ